MVTLQSSVREQFEELGYVVVKGILDLDEDIQPVMKEYAELLDLLAKRWHSEGKISSTYEQLPFGTRLACVASEASEAGLMYTEYFDISMSRPVITADTPIHVGRAVFNLLRSPRLLDGVEYFIGSEIYSNPIQHVRIKPPQRLLSDGLKNHGLAAATPFHQDISTVIPEADDTNMLTVWVPITEATPENGCLSVVPRSHKGELTLQCLTGSNFPDGFIATKRVPLPMSPGDVLYMHKRTIHGALPNISDDVRFSLDLRYNPIGQPTGRPWFPGFVARSRMYPRMEMKDPEQWAQSWIDTRSHLAGKAESLGYRATLDNDPLCA